jgi:peptidoglycan/xylan/chitin deacetylase (PgdA/CDA1 family)
MILGWHDVTGSPCFPRDADAGRDGFRRQVRLLTRIANPVPLLASLRALAAGEALPPRAVALTFDDGYRDNATFAAPLLHEMGVPATFFLVPSYLDGRLNPWWEELAWAWNAVPPEGGDAAGWVVPPADAGRAGALIRATHELKSVDRRRREERVAALVAAVSPRTPSPAASGLMMDWDDAAGLARAGFEIGSHTDAHPILSMETPQEQHRQIRRARGALQRRLGVPVPVVAYPNGTHRDIDADTFAAVRGAGHEFGVTTIWGRNRPCTDPLALRRVLVQPTRVLRTLRHDYRDRPWTGVRLPHAAPDGNHPGTPATPR